MQNFSPAILALVLCLLAGSWSLAQEKEPPVDGEVRPAGATLVDPVSLLPVKTARTGPLTMDLDPVSHFPPGGPPYSLFSPFEVSVRPFLAAVEGSGPLSNVLDGGVGVDFSVRSFLFNDRHTAAWYGDVGLGYQYNRGSDPSQSVIIREGTTNVSRFGSIVPLDSTTSLGVRELHRTTVRLAFGREFYFESRWPERMYYAWGGDVGGIWGQASIKTDVNDRDIPDIQANDTILYNPTDGHSSGVTKGFFLGTSFNMVFPRHTHDFTVGTRFEWQREYFNHLVTNNDGTGQLKFMLEFGWRY